MSQAIAWPAGLALLGLIVGSFVATLAIRWPAGRSVVRGRSMCDACGATLGLLELVPLVSALMLRGRCRTCGAPIDARHWIVELGCGGAGALAGMVAPGPAGLAGAAFGWLLIALAALDLAALWLPDRLTLPLALGGLLTGALGLAPLPQERLIGGAAGFALLWALRVGYRRLAGREGLGGGDAKLFGAIGLWLGWRLLPAMLLLASGAGLLALLALRLAGRPVDRLTRVPFGALLAAAAYPAWLAMIGSGP